MIITLGDALKELMKETKLKIKQKKGEKNDGQDIIS